jgi:hypothetical protein
MIPSDAVGVQDPKTGDKLVGRDGKPLLNSAPVGDERYVLTEKLTRPHKGEEKQEFISRFMSSELAKKEFKDNKQRVAVAYNQWERGRLRESEIVNEAKRHPLLVKYGANSLKEEFLLEGIEKYKAEKILERKYSLKKKMGFFYLFYLMSFLLSSLFFGPIGWFLWWMLIGHDIEHSSKEKASVNKRFLEKFSLIKDHSLVRNTKDLIDLELKKEKPDVKRLKELKKQFIYSVERAFKEKGVNSEGYSSLITESESLLKKYGVEGYNKPKRTPGHKTKSHLVVAKKGGDVRVVRFGAQGAKGSPSKEGESASWKKRRQNWIKRHRAQNPSGFKDKFSALYWANKVKW